tara:strand:- start:78 stop:1169 length:1092 start_codon:yes stop_codon:yes gene_type:complete
MSDQVQENTQEDEVLEDVVADQEVEVVESDEADGEQLDEKQASMGDPSSIPEPAPIKAPVPKTKVGMIKAMVDFANGKKKDDVKMMFKAMMDPDAEKDDDEKMERMNIKSQKKAIKSRYNPESLDLSADIKALFGEEDLSEDFKSKATTIFETAVLTRINEALESTEVDVVAEVESEKELVKEEMSAKLDDYLDYVVNEWVKDNELAIEQGIRSEIVENFMVGLRNLFTENYIDIPEEKVDIVDEMATKVEDTENAVNEEIEKNIALQKELNDLKSDKVFKEVSEGLTETQKEKFKSLAESVEYNDEYAEKLDTLKNNYFPQEEVAESNDVSDEEPLENLEEETKVNGSMAGYMSAISRSIKK